MFDAGECVLNTNALAGEVGIVLSSTLSLYWIRYVGGIDLRTAVATFAAAVRAVSNIGKEEQIRMDEELGGFE